jgi:plastocyanin
MVTDRSPKVMHSLRLLAGLALVLAPVSAARADETAYTLVLKDHRFTPTTLEIPAGQKARLVIHNQDDTVEEFDSDDLHREKVIPGGQTGSLVIGPLGAGQYRFQGEYHGDSAVGEIIVK